jgi:S-adenosylmethionine:tRNA ribosyltransferase-isomerase
MTDLIKIRIEDYDYHLPEGRIAKYPLEVRDQSKLLIYNCKGITADSFVNLSGYLKEGSLLVFNDTRVIHARLEFKRETGSRIEVFCLEPAEPSDYSLMFQKKQVCTWWCMIGNLKKWKNFILEKTIYINEFQVNLNAERLVTNENASLIKFSWDQDVAFGELIEAAGTLPLPPYLNREAIAEDDLRYQTIYSKEQGSVAAPTAGLHFTEEVFSSLREKNIDKSFVTLHVGAGTFKPVKSDLITGHEMHTEHFSVPIEVLEQIINKKGPLVAVGTTSVRTLESLFWLGTKTVVNPLVKPEELFTSQWEPYENDVTYNRVDVFDSLKNWMKRNKLKILHSNTRIMIVPGYKFRVVEAIITNFHQPKSTLLLLISAWVGEDWKRIYSYAGENGFRFLSYGDSSILFRREA